MKFLEPLKQSPELRNSLGSKDHPGTRVRAKLSGLKAWGGAGGCENSDTVILSARENS